MSTPPTNPLNVRLPFDLEGKAHSEVVKAIRYAFSGLLDINQAIPYLATKSEVSAAKSTITNIINSGGGGGGGSTVFIGVVNDQLGQPSYTTQPFDNGAKLIVGDSTPVTINLNPAVSTPWFCFIDNDSSAVANLVPGSGLLNGAQLIFPGCFGIVAFDGTNFWSGSIPMATDSSLGIVQPDNVTIGIDSGMIHTIGATGTINLGPFLDSSMTAITVLDGLITGWTHTP